MGDNSSELWRSVVGLPDYEVSSLGTVRRVTVPRRGGAAKPGRLLKPYKRRDGYLFLMLRAPDGKRTTMRIHRMVCEAFIGPYAPGQETHHVNGQKDDNRLENLRQVSQQTNSVLAWQMGQNEACRCRGSKNGVARLCETQVIEMKGLLESGVPRPAIANRFGVAYGTVYDISIGRRWEWLQLTKSSGQPR